MGELFGRPMKALSLWQPWAALMAAHVKLHETRHWKTAYRGPIAIHAAKRLDVAGAPEDLCIAALGADWRTTIPLGAVVAVGRLTGCRDAHLIRRLVTAGDLEAGNFSGGRFAWRVEDLRELIEPIPTLGRQGLFDWLAPADLADRLKPAFDHAEACRVIGWA